MIKLSIVIGLFSCFYVGNIKAQAESLISIKSDYSFERNFAYNDALHLELSMPKHEYFTLLVNRSSSSYHLKLESQKLFNNMSFTQSRVDNLVPGLGSFSFYNNSIGLNLGNNGSINMGAGLVQQSSHTSALSPSLQLHFNTKIEYSINSWLRVYLYGQYISKSINPHAMNIDPVMYMNPLFIQSEAGAGIKARHRNIEADFGTKSIFDTQFQKSKPFNLMNSKINIGF
ncbi:MAG: hypothetical protein MI866_00725 [Bacteroidales bacterium]|nr:hypothetical protein [Bacteroidales bacterium]